MISLEFVHEVPGEDRRERQTRQQRGRRWEARRVELEEVDIIAWDGEGLGHPEHHYCLLANSLGLKLRTYDLVDGRVVGKVSRSLPTEEVLDVVWRTGVAHPRAFQVMYGASYDWNNWIRDISYDTAKWTNDGYPVKIGKYTYRYNGMWFEVHRGNREVRVWDVWRFWGYGFVGALEDTLPDFHGLPMIRRFKELRGEFTEEILPEVEQYNDLELEGLVSLVRRLFLDLNSAGIRRPGFLTGSGAIAGSILGQNGVADHNVQASPAAVLDAVHRGFSAGRIECWQVGTHQGPLYVHDIRSAYPNAMQHLPSLRGTWEWTDTLLEGWDDRMAVYHVSWDHFQERPPTRRYYPFFFRNDKGMVMYPGTGEGWHWWPEVLTAKELGWKFKINGGWVLRQEDPTAYPFSWVPELYRRRAVLKKAGQMGAQRVLKYGLNSLYGKMCQARGSLASDPPRFHNLAWAGWVTSHCRATLMQAMHPNPDSIVFCMTDSLASTVPLDVDEGDGLGQWEVACYDRALVVQAGVGSLWRDHAHFAGRCVDPECDCGMEGHEDGLCRVTDKYRGFDRGTIDPARIVQQWNANQVSGRREPITVDTVRPITLGSALVNEEWFAKWNTWQPLPRELDIYGGDGKRVLLEEVRHVKPWQKLVPLEPFTTLPLAELRQLGLSQSAPYQPRWADQDPMTLVEIDGVLVDDRILKADVEAGALA